MITVIYTDGACTGNPGGLGGYAAIVLPPSGTSFEIVGSQNGTTNNRMELMAVICGLERTDDGDTVAVFSDSQYVVRGATAWLKGWKRRGWRTATSGEVKNKDLWERIDDLMSTRCVTFEWVRGHIGDHHNERCDELAKQAIVDARCAAL